MKLTLLFGVSHGAGTLAIRGGVLVSSAGIASDCESLAVEVSDANLASGSFPCIVTVDVPQFPFSFNLRDVSSEYPIYVAEAGCIVLPEGDARSYSQVLSDIHARGLVSDFQRMEAAPEESYENACRYNRDQVCPTWLGLSRDLRIFHVDAQEGTQMWGRVTPFYHSKVDIYEHPEIPMSYQRDILFEIGPGAHCRPHLTRRLDDGVLPIFHGTQYEQNIEYRLTMFASLENGPVSKARVRGSRPLPAFAKMSYAMMTDEEKEAVKTELPGETTEREEEMILFLRVEAVNVGKTPEYAWFKAPHTMEGKVFKDGLCLEHDKAFAAVLLNGEPAREAEYAVLVTPSRPVVWECRIFHTAKAPGRARRIFGQDYDAHLAGARAYWREKLSHAAQIHIPEPAIDERIRAGLLHLDINTLGLAEDGPLLAGVGWYSPIGSESSPIIQFYDAMGWHKEAERCIDFFLSRQKDNGFIQVYNNYESETGPVLWTAGEHYRMTRDNEWLARVTPALEKSCECLLAWRERNKREEFRATGGYGLLNGKVADPDDFFHSYFLNAGTLLGLAAMSEVLKDTDAAYAEKLASELVLYRADLRASMEFSLRRAPVVPQSDGTWIPRMPPWSEYTGDIALYADGGMWFTHGSFAARSSLVGAMYFALTDLYEPQSLMMDMLLKGNQHPVTRENAALSQPYYSRHDIAHLRRGEVKEYLKTFYNQCTALQDRQSYTFWEHYYHVSQHKTHEEGWFLMQIRWMLAYEEGNVLELFRCIPRKWMEAGKTIGIQGMYTHFGRLDATLTSTGDTIVADIHVERMPEKMLVRLPHAQEKKATWVSGGDYEPRTETVTVAGANAVRIEARF